MIECKALWMPHEGHCVFVKRYQGHRNGNFSHIGLTQ